MLTCLSVESVLTRLENLKIGFENSPGRDDRKSGRLLPLTRSLLPVLTMFQFKGDSEYLENLLVGIGVPLLDELDIVFFHRTTLSTPQLTLLISRTTQFMGLDRACFKFDSSADSRRTPLLTFGNSLNYGISGYHLHSRVWALVRACSSSVPPALVSGVKFLYCTSLRRNLGYRIGSATSRETNGYNFSIHLPTWRVSTCPMDSFQLFYQSCENLSGKEA